MTLESLLLSSVPGVRHAFFTRAGGVSTGIYAGLNGGLGSNDEPDKVRKIDAAWRPSSTCRWRSC
jgi:copper oxidase (laccase) domain-containing protein